MRGSLPRATRDRPSTADKDGIVTKSSTHAPTDQPADTVALDGTWTTDYQGATAGDDAALRLRFSASEVRTVVGGEGTVTAVVRDASGAVVDEVEHEISGSPRSYRLLARPDLTTGTVELRATPGVQVYSFTFG